MSYKTLTKLNKQEYERLQVLAKDGINRAEELFGKNEIADLIGKTGLSPDQQSAQGFLQDYNSSDYFDPAINFTTGVLDGSNPFVQQTGQNATNYNNWLNNLNTGTPGMTPDMSFAQDRTKDIIGTQGTAGLDQLVDARETVGNVISSGGFTPELNKMAGAGYGLLNSGGFTDDLMSFISGMSGMIGGYNGPSAEAKQAFDAAMKIVNAGGEGGGLIPVDLLMAQVRDEVTQQGINSGNAAIEQFVKRGGSFGAGVGTGGPLAEFADQNVQAQARALREGRLDAQNLRLQREMGALGTAGQLGSSIESSKGQQESARIGAMGSLASAGVSYAGNAMRTGADLIGSANSTAANMWGNANQAMAQYGNIFANREQNAFNNSLALGQQANSNVALGSDLSRSMYTTGLDASSILGNLAGAQNNSVLNQQNALFGMGQQGVNNQFQLQGMNQDQANLWLQMLTGNALQGMNNMYTSTAPAAMARQGIGQQFGQLGFGALQGAIGGALSGFQIPGLSSLPGFGGTPKTIAPTYSGSNGSGMW